MSTAQKNSNPFTEPSLVETYEDWYSTQGKRADHLEKELLQWLINHFEDPISILEVGCGTGHFARWFESIGLRSIGLDLSLVMLREAQRYGLRSIVQGDATLLPFEDDTFDLVTMITTIEFIQQPLKALHDATRVAKKGIFLGVINRESWIGRQYRRQGGLPWQSARFFSPEELIRMLKTIKDPASEPFWRTTLWRFTPWALPLRWGGFIGMGIKLKG
jgi:ubiquinone/menaquinone biosynthesis C-methylase UbiE